MMEVTENDYYSSEYTNPVVEIDIDNIMLVVDSFEGIDGRAYYRVAFHCFRPTKIDVKLKTFDKHHALVEFFSYYLKDVENNQNISKYVLVFY